MREVFARFAIESVATRYTVAGGKWSDVAEIIVTGPAKEPLAAVRDLLSIQQHQSVQMASVLNRRR
jgi:hypothetical protein